MSDNSPRPTRAAIGLALATVYFIWGSTYLAMRVAVETMPPALMAGARFLAAGALIYGVERARGAPAPTRREWLGAAAIGMLLLVTGNGLVAYAIRRVPSGIAAVLVATVPCWLVTLQWVRPGGTRPPFKVLLGLAVGLAGVALLAGLGPETLGQRVDPSGLGIILLACFSWAAGSLLSREVARPASGFLASGMQMLVGGVILLGWSVVSGAGRGWEPALTSGRSLLALAYLVLGGSVAAYSAYLWLLSVGEPAVVGTYAFVNPIVAVLLGRLVLGEPLTPRVLAASAIVLAAVVLITVRSVPGLSRLRSLRIAAARE